ncbi:MAG: death-on-curing family protein [Parcubacteria group bacterium Athens0714_26]|nr:MAG: death-on-curing family protein [Parcubacteria group bacterium Athens1014_26]TSD03698.1 MAG: death-on-curing family protein [Parcubacteria group bacterium Athens0714_26]
MKYLNVVEVEYMAYDLAKQLMSWDEPIPDFNTRFPEALERCLEAVRQTFDKKFLYKGLTGKAAILFYLMIKNHPFQNGNKRIAVTTLFYFLQKNGKWLKIDNQELYNFAVWVAESNPKVKEQTVSATESLVKNYLADF